MRKILLLITLMAVASIAMMLVGGAENADNTDEKATDDSMSYLGV